MGYYFLSRMAAAALTLVTLVVLTRVLAPADFGLYNIVIMAGTTAFAFLFAWVPAVIIRFHTAAEFDGRATAWTLGAGAVALAVAAPLLLLALPFYEPDWRAAILLGAAFCAAHAANEYGLSGLRVLNQGPAFAFGVVLRPIVGVGLALAFVAMGGGYASAVAGMAIGSVVTGIYALGRVIRVTGIGLPRWSALRTFLAFGVPLSLVTSNAMVQILITQAILARIADLAAVGIFAAAQTLALRAIAMPMMTLTRASAASIFEAYETDGHAAADVELDRHFSFLMLISVPIFGTLMLANDTVATILFDGTFRASVAAHLPILAAAAFIAGVQGSYLAYAFLITRRTSIQLVIMVVGALLHALLSLAMIAAIGPIGASWAVLGSAAASFAAYLVAGRRVRPQIADPAEVRKAAVGLLALAPFALYAETVGHPLLAFACLGLGALAFCAALQLQNQMAMSAVMRKLLRLGRRTRA